MHDVCDALVFHERLHARGVDNAAGADRHARDLLRRRNERETPRLGIEIVDQHVESAIEKRLDRPGAYAALRTGDQYPHDSSPRLESHYQNLFSAPQRLCGLMSRL